MSQKKKLQKEEMEKFRRMLQERRASIAGEVEHLEKTAMRQKGTNHTGEVTFLPTHMADAATDSYNQEVAFGLIQNEREETQAIDEALEKIDNNTYGLCEECSEPIPRTRLRALPYAKLCIKCKEKQETG